MAIPKQPRQVMINLMYIVLTALLAMNVSAEILHAFHVVNSGIENSNKVTASKNSQVMKEFSDELQYHQKETQPYYDKAVEAQAIVSEFVKKIEVYKTAIIQQSGGWTDEKKVRHSKPGDPEIGNWSPERGTLYDDRNLDVTTRLMVDEKGGDEVQNHIEVAREQLLALIDDTTKRKALAAQLPLHVDLTQKDEYGETTTWTKANFDMMPTIASITLLNKFQNDASNSEMQILDYLYSNIYIDKAKVNAMQARVIAPSNYILTGTPYKADILIAAYNSNENPEIIVGSLNQNAVKDPLTDSYEKTLVNPVNNGTTIDVVGGIGKFFSTPHKSGPQHYSGAVVVKGTKGEPNYYPFESDYLAADAAAVVSSDNLNVIYSAIPNPFTISVPGFAAENVSATISEGSLTRVAPGKYEVNIPLSSSGHMVNISVSAKMPDGSTKPITSLPYKVKSVPPPVATVYGKYGGLIKKNELLLAKKVDATLQNFYFQNVSYDITNFKCIYIPAKNGGPTLVQEEGKVFSPELKKCIEKCKPGDRFIFESIYSKGPGGTYPLSGISLEVK